MDTLNDLVHTLFQRELEVKAGQSGSFTMTVDATSLFHSSAPPAAMNPFLLPAPQPRGIHISQIQIAQSLQTRLSSTQQVSLTGMATAQGPRGYGLAVASFVQALSPQQSVQLSVMAGARSKVAAEVTQALTSSLQGGVSLGYGSEGTEVDLKLARSFSEQMVGVLGVSLGQSQSCSLTMEKATPAGRWKGEAFVGADAGVRFSRLLVNETDQTKLKLSLNASVTEIGGELLLGKDVTPLSKLNCVLALGTAGVSVKWKFQRGGMTFVLPIILGTSVSQWGATLAGVSVPLLVAGSWWLWRRATASNRCAEWGRGERVRGRETARRHEREFRSSHARAAALSQQRMMRGVSERSRREEAAKGGLVIRYAAYGAEAAVHCPARVAAGKGALEVTTALQFMVRESRLRLFAGSKREYMGMCLEEGAEKPVLLVRYEFGSKVYEIEVEDLEPLYLPAFRALEIGEKDVVGVWGVCWECLMRARESAM